MYPCADIRHTEQGSPGVGSRAYDIRILQFTQITLNSDRYTQFHLHLILHFPGGKGINIVGGKTLTKPRFYPWTQKLNWNTEPDAGDVIDRTDLDQAYSDLLDQDYN